MEAESGAHKGAVEAEIVTDPAALDAFKDDWRLLAEQRGNAFVTPEWFFTWFDHYGDGHQPMVSVVRYEDRAIAGLMPLALSTSTRPRTLRFAGGSLGDNFHPVAREADDEAVAQATGLALGRQRRGWSTIVLDNVEIAASWPERLAAALPSPLTVKELRTGLLPYISFNGRSWEGYQKARSKNLRRERGRKLRRLEREYEVSFRRTEDPEALADDMATMFRLHDRRRSQLGGSSLASDRARAFLLDFAAAAMRRGWLRLWFLEADGEPVAANYDWCIGGRYAFYQGGFDPAWSRHSVGSVLEDHRIRSAIEEGAETFDWLLGEEAYKLKQAESERRVHTLVVVRSRHPARLLAEADVGLGRVARALPEGLRRRVRGAAGALLNRLPSARRR